MLLLIVAELFLFCYDRYLMLSLSGNYQADVFAALNSSRILDYILRLYYVSEVWKQILHKF